MPIALSQVKITSTCLELGLARDLCCDVCKVKIDAQCGLAKRSSEKIKRYRDYAENSVSKCKQPWDEKYGTNKCTKATNKKFFRVRKF